MPQHIHMAGIIPVAGLKTNFNQQLPEVMMPVDCRLYCIQKSVYECAMVGCQTIWIVANNDLAPIIRSTVGEWIYDPVYYETKTYFHRKTEKKYLFIMSLSTLTTAISVILTGGLFFMEHTVHG